MCEISDDSLSLEYFNMEEVVWDKCEVDFHHEIEEMSEYIRFDALFLSSSWLSGTSRRTGCFVLSDA